VYLKTVRRPMSLTADDIKTVVAMTKHPGYAIIRRPLKISVTH